MRYYVDKSEVNKVLEKVTKDQMKRNVFCNVSVKEYKGKNYPADTVVVKVG